MQLQVKTILNAIQHFPGFVYQDIHLRIAPKVLLPGRGAGAGQNHSLCQKSGYRGRNG